MNVTFGKISLPVNKIPNPYIPSEQKIVGYKNVLDNLALAVDRNLPVLLIGETGLGKTALIRYLAYRTKNGFRRLNLNGQTTVDEFVGRTLLNKDGTFWQDGVLIDAMRKGYWLLLDEINAALPEILFVMHSLLDDDRMVVIPENGGEVVHPHPNFRMFATMNPSGKYHGTKELNKAFLSRFPIVMQLEYPNVIQEAKIIKEFVPTVTKKNIDNLCMMARDIRAAYFKDDIDMICSTRELINCAHMFASMPPKDAIELTITNRANKEDEKAVRTIAGLYFGVEETKENTGLDLLLTMQTRFAIENQSALKNLRQMTGPTSITVSSIALSPFDAEINRIHNQIEDQKNQMIKAIESIAK